MQTSPVASNVKYQATDICHDVISLVDKLGEIFTWNLEGNTPKFHY